MKLKILFPTTLALLALAACNGGGGEGSSNPGNDDQPLPANLQTYSYVANLANANGQPGSVSVCQMTLNGYYREPCDKISTNVMSSPYAVAVNKSNNRLFVTGNVLSGAGLYQNCQIQPTNGLLTCDPSGSLSSITSPDSIALYYPNNQPASQDQACAFIADANDSNGSIYSCAIDTNDKLTNNCNLALQTGHLGKQYGLAITGNTLYVSNVPNNPSIPGKVYSYNITGNCRNAGSVANNNNPAFSDGGNSSLLSTPAKMVINSRDNYLYVSNIGTNSVAEYNYPTPNQSQSTSTSTVFKSNDGIAINPLYLMNTQNIPQENNAFIYVTNSGGSEGPYISKCPITGNGTLGKCVKLGSGFNSPYAIAISGPVNPNP